MSRMSRAICGTGRALGLLVALAALHAQAAGSSPAGPGWALRVPGEARPAFHGVVDFDKAGTGAMNMLYPAPNAAGLIVAILTHGAIAEGAKASQKTKMEEQANRVLAPYQAILDAYASRELAERALAIAGAGRLAEANEQPEGLTLLETAPAFSMTQDERAIVLDNEIGLRLANGATRKAAVRVVSQTRAEDDVRAYWSGNGGSSLKQTMALLYAESLLIAIADSTRAGDGADLPQRTFRYHEGSQLKIERAQLLDESCNRVVIRTLRGSLMSIPVQRSGDEAGKCMESDAGQR